MRRRNDFPRRRNAGIALVIVLWLIALLSLLAVGQTATVRTETLVTGNQVTAAQARAAAYGGIQLGLLELLRPSQARNWHADGSVYPAELDGVALHISLADETGKVDLNFASGPLLDALLRAAEVEDDVRIPLVDAILDWRDPDDLRRADGAEREAYAAAGLDYAPRNGPMQSTEELMLVLGMDAALYHTLADSITVHSGNAVFNPTVASGRVLQRMVQDGVTQGGTVGVHDDDGADAAPPAAAARGGAAGRVYTVRCTAQMPDGVREQYEALVRVTPARGAGAPLHEMLVWREGAGFDNATGWNVEPE
jgi:general secretion pathway protein K